MENKLYKDTLLTEKGYEAANLAANGQGSFTITRVVASENAYNGKTDNELRQLLSLDNEIPGTILEENTVNTKMAAIKTGLSNELNTNGYIANTVGLYASLNGGDEFLYSVTPSTNGQIVPKQDNNVFSGFKLTIYVLVGNSQKLEVNLSPGGDATIDYVNKAVSRCRDELLALIKNRVIDNHDGSINYSGVDYSLSLTIDKNSDVFKLAPGIYKSLWGFQDSLKNYPSPNGSSFIIVSGVANSTDNGRKIKVIDSWGGEYNTQWTNTAFTPWEKEVKRADIDEIKNKLVKDDPYYNIINYGAVRDDESFDNGAIINKIISLMPNNGGTILIPNGKFFIASTIDINRSYVRIMGINGGLRSNIDPEVGQGLTHPGGGSRLILKPKLSTGIQIGVSGGSPRISGVEINNINLLGANINWGDHVSQTFIKGAQDSDNIKIHDNVIINVDYGIVLSGADTPEIKNNWISELKNGVHLLGSSQQAQIENNYLGCQPSGITLKLDNPYSANITGNNIYPDGYECIEINNGTMCNITSNNIQSFYVGALKITGNNNIIASNLLYAKMNGSKWSSDPINRDGKFGFIQIGGDSNTLVSNHVVSEQPVNDTRILIKYGNNNVLKVNSIFGNSSNSKIVIDKSANNNESIFNGIEDSEFQNFGNDSNTNFEGFKKTTVLPNGTDLNNVTGTGNYQLYWGYTYSNQPQLSGKTTQFIRVENNGNEIYQTAKHPWIDTFLVRKRTFGNWSTWTEIASRNEVISAIKQSYTAGSSLDNYTATGTYPMNSIDLGALPSNLGLPSITINGVLQVANEGSTGTQTIRDDNNNVWERQFYRAWHKVATSGVDNANATDMVNLQNQVNGVLARQNTTINDQKNTINNLINSILDWQNKYNSEKSQSDYYRALWQKDENRLSQFISYAQGHGTPIFY